LTPLKIGTFGNTHFENWSPLTLLRLLDSFFEPCSGAIHRWKAEYHTITAMSSNRRSDFGFSFYQVKHITKKDVFCGAPSGKWWGLRKKLFLQNS